MNAANVELTQGVSQVSGPAMISIADDLLHTQRMTIEDLIESTQVFFGYWSPKGVLCFVSISI
jgi:hypothetical protein